MGIFDRNHRKLIARNRALRIKNKRLEKQLEKVRKQYEDDQEFFNSNFSENQKNLRNLYKNLSGIRIFLESDLDGCTRNKIIDSGVEERFIPNVNEYMKRTWWASGILLNILEKIFKEL